MVWRVGNGRTINCWKDSWIPNEGKIADRLLRNPTCFENCLRVSDLVDCHRNWSLENLVTLVPDDIIQKILSMLAPNPAREDDRVAWKLSKDGCFTNLSAYCSLLDQNQALNHNLNKRIWTCSGPERYKIHLWKIS